MSKILKIIEIPSITNIPKGPEFTKIYRYSKTLKIPEILKIVRILNTSQFEVSQNSENFALDLEYSKDYKDSNGFKHSKESG